MRTLRRADPILIQAVIAAALSFAHIHDIAEAAGQTGWKAWAYPVSVDLLFLAAWRRMRTVGGASAWIWFLVAMAASLGANVATSGVMNLSDPPAWLRVAVAGWPAVALFGGTLLMHARRAGDASDELREASAQDPQGAASEPPASASNDEVGELQICQEKPVLVSYAQAAEALGVAPETIRGWAAQGHVTKHPGPTANTVRVELKECRSYQNRRTVMSR
ncbi:DUF2637 domain-containing protein [Streptomyces varsoviensis]|uniref:DUF2637 domain-containing protein n=1 Tax=Streptomyces varsoviensis TaxID=67373 RepID=UPI0033D945FD